ncbi:DUF2273 domain-containing protein [Nocardioides sp.]|uniref:DUF2273 domain-containing protein n=1 Tax=Nocardioides sp. TaxID=35761 RepID=UPI003513B703
MSTSSLGLIAGLLLTLAICVGGLVGFLLALVLGTAGFALGGHYDGELDLGQLLGRRSRG